MQLIREKPQADFFPLVVKLLADKALEEGEEYEYIPFKPLDPRGAGKHSTPRRREEPAVTALAKQLKSLETQKLQQIMSALQQEMKSRQDASVGSAHDVSSILQTLLKEGALKTNIPKLSAFSGEMAKGGYHLNSGAMISKPSESPTVTLSWGKESSIPW